MGLFLHKVYQLMSEKGLTYNEACREVGTHGGEAKKSHSPQESWEMDFGQDYGNEAGKHFSPLPTWSCRASL